MDTAKYVQPLFYRDATDITYALETLGNRLMLRKTLDPQVIGQNPYFLK